MNLNTFRISTFLILNSKANTENGWLSKTRSLYNAAVVAPALGVLFSHFILKNNYQKYKRAYFIIAICAFAYLILINIAISKNFQGWFGEEPNDVGDPESIKNLEAAVENARLELEEAEKEEDCISRKSTKDEIDQIALNILTKARKYLKAVINLTEPEVIKAKSELQKEPSCNKAQAVYQKALAANEEAQKELEYCEAEIKVQEMTKKRRKAKLNMQKEENLLKNNKLIIEEKEKIYDKAKNTVEGKKEYINCEEECIHFEEEKEKAYKVYNDLCISQYQIHQSCIQTEIKERYQEFKEAESRFEVSKTEKEFVYAKLLFNEIKNNTKFYNFTKAEYEYKQAEYEEIKLQAIREAKELAFKEAEKKYAAAMAALAKEEEEQSEEIAILQ